MAYKIMKLSKNEYMIRVPAKVADKVLAVEDGLNELGVKVGRVNFAAKGGHISLWIDGVKNAWLLYSIAKEAIGKWPAIQEMLKNAGLSDDEIITLDLSKYTNEKKKRKKSKKSKKKPTS